MKRKAPVRRNPVARAVRSLRQQKIQSAKAYRRRAKHMKARPDQDSQDGLFILRFRGPLRPRGLTRRRAAGRG
jgi:hypothetical protein